MQRALRAASATGTWMHFDRRVVRGLVQRGYLTSRRDPRVSTNSPFTWQYKITAMGRRVLRQLDGDEEWTGGPCTHGLDVCLLCGHGVRKT